jgi:hypothetical protein
LADYFTAVRITDAEFTALLEKVETAFARNEAALVLDPKYGIYEIQILDSAAAGFTRDETDTVIWLDQLLFFGMRESSEETVRDWATVYDESLADVAVHRARALRAALPSVAAAWDAKGSTLLPVPTAIQHEVLFTEDGDPRATVSIQSFKVHAGGDADPLSRQELVLQMLKSDVAYLQSELSYLLETMEREPSERETE